MIVQDMVFQVRVNNSDPMPFYCTTGEHCTRNMHGVVNGRGDFTLRSYRSSITVNRDAVAPTAIGGGTLLPNNITNILEGPADFLGEGVAMRASLLSVVLGVSVALFCS
jgi:hypothetical protein